MTSESTDNRSAEEILADEIVQQAEEQVEVQLDAATDNVSAELEKINELELSLAGALATVAEQKDSVVRAKAEVDNVRRRAAQDVEKARKFALEKFAGELLSTVDNLERATDNLDLEDEKQKSIGEGVNLTLQSLLAALDKFGVKVVDPKTNHLTLNFIKQCQCKKLKVWHQIPLLLLCKKVMN